MYNFNRWLPGVPHPAFLNNLVNYGRGVWRNDVVHPFQQYVAPVWRKAYGTVRRDVGATEGAIHQGIHNTTQTLGQDYARVKKRANQQYRHVRNTFSNDYHQGRRIIGNEVAGAIRAIQVGSGRGSGAGHSKSKTTGGPLTANWGSKTTYIPSNPTPSAANPSATGDYYARQVYNSQMQNPPPAPKSKVVPFPRLPDPYAGYPVAKPNLMERWNDYVEDAVNLPFNGLQKASNYFGDLLHQNRLNEQKNGVTPGSLAVRLPYGLAKFATGILPGLHELSDDLPKDIFLTNTDGAASGLLFPDVIANNIWRGLNHGKSPALLNAMAQTGVNEHRAAQDHFAWMRPAGYDPPLFGHHQSSVLQTFADVGNNYLNLVKPSQWEEDPVGNFLTLADLDDPLARISGKIEHLAGEGAEGAGKAGHPTGAAAMKQVQKGAGKISEGLEKYGHWKEDRMADAYRALTGLPKPHKFAVHQAGTGAFKVVDLTTGKWIKNPHSRVGFYGSAEAAKKAIDILAPPVKKVHVWVPDTDTSSPPADKKRPQGRPANGMERLNRYSPAELAQMKRHFNLLGHKYSASGYGYYR